jgi:Flp pilus assembly pilin Flp
MSMLKIGVPQFVKAEHGASLVEYAVLLTLITLILVASVGGLNAALIAALNGAAAVIAPS